jgi:hypothetical protein
MHNSGEPTPNRSAGGIELPRRSGRFHERFLHHIGHRRGIGAEQSGGISPHIHAVVVVQRGPGVAAALLQAANYSVLRVFIQQLAVSTVRLIRGT